MNKRILILKNTKNEGPGIIQLVLKNLNIKYIILDFYKKRTRKKIDYSQFSGLIIMGGPMAVYENEKYPFIQNEIELVQLFLKNNKKILGICLGAQIIAKAVEGNVYKGKQNEIGFYNIYMNEYSKVDKYFKSFPDYLPVFQWHQDTFSIVDPCLNLAYSDLFDNQIIKVNDNCYGLQFHFEADYNMIIDWLSVNKNISKQKKQVIRDEAGLFLSDLNAIGMKFFTKFFS